MAVSDAFVKTTSSTQSATLSHWCAVAALVLATVGLAGSLLLSLAMGLRACPLCFYQRTFMMSLVGVLAMGLLTGMGSSGKLSLMTLPLAMAGLGVASFHSYLEIAGKLECPKGLFGWGTAPQQSLALFAVVVAILLLDAVRGLPTGGVGNWATFAGSVVLGALLAIGSCISNPPMTPLPREAYAKKPDVCRVPLPP